MIEVEVLINNFKDNANYSKKTKVIRNGKEIEIEDEFLQKGDIYKVSKERYKYLSDKRIVAKAKKQVKEEVKEEQEPEGE